MESTFFEFIKPGTRIDFLKQSKPAFLLSTFLMLGTVFLLATRGLNYGVDFRGGTEMHVRFNAGVQAAQVRAALEDFGLEEAMVQGFGTKTSGDFLIRATPEEFSYKPLEPQIKAALTPMAAGAESLKLRFAEDKLFVSLGKEVEPALIREAISNLKISRLDVEDISITDAGTTKEYKIVFAGVSSRMRLAFEKKFGKGAFEVLQIDQVGAKVGAELRMQAVGAILISIIFILIYIWFRFDFESAPGAIAALIHDALFVLGCFSLFQWPFDLSIVAAVLTIVGFSINDTIVIYDRIRENRRKMKEVDITTVINASINQTLGRTILTSGTVLMATLSLMIWGGPITFHFALAFTIGLISGTYSTVYVASPFTIYLHNRAQKKSISG